MDESNLLHNPRGSIWHRWDPHLHAPGTLRNDQFNGDWEAYLQRIELSSPPVRALGVTDYFCIRTYREVRRRKAAGRLREVEFIFPNVEMRLDIKTEKQQALNIHLLFSPEDPDHEAQIERILGHLEFEAHGRRYRCTESDLIALGGAADPDQTDPVGALRVGANQFKTTLKDLRELFHKEEWLRKNCLVAVAGGRDGTAGLKADDSFATTRQEIERFAHIIFSGSPKQREFWLGQTPGCDRAMIEKIYGALKPCLHGSDAHRDDKVAAPALDRYCWIKGDLTFESLCQSVIEPEERVWIGASPPVYGMASVSVTEIRTTEAPWLKNDRLPFNPGLIAVIGARGSGKTALVDLVAAGASAIGDMLGDSSFLRRAATPVDHLGNATVELSWGDGSISQAILSEAAHADILGEASAQARYLSQQFVDRLCSSAGLASELRREMDRVIFDATDPTDRFEASSFDELANTLLEPVRHRREELRATIEAATEAVVREDLLNERLSGMRAQRETLSQQIKAGRKDVQSLIPKGKEERAKRLMELEDGLSKAEAKLENLRRRRRKLDELGNEIAHLRTHTEPARLAAVRARFADAPFTEPEWAWFGMTFVGDVDGLLVRAKATLDKAIRETTEGDTGRSVDIRTTPLAQWPLSVLRVQRDAVKKEVGIDEAQQKKYNLLQAALTTQEATLRRVEAEMKTAEGATQRRRERIQSRREAYADIFGTFAEEEQVLRQLYAPLHTQLVGKSGALAKLQFVVLRRIDLDAWVKQGESLLDLRQSSAFRGHGALRRIVEQELVSAWKQGDAKAVAEIMDAFREKYKNDLRNAMPATVDAAKRAAWVQSVAAWLYDTSHLHIEYGIHYEGVAIEQLSPGTRGIVLLLLYLAIDVHDRRPLVVDQPEENLDPNSVFQELVPHFREARKRRQVIIVTHNANLVVNTDADQVIVATSIGATDGGLPTIKYRSGSLENPTIRTRVCEILEGGERAFLERERRYRLHWGDVTN